MTAQSQKHKLKTISWLMTASEILLFLFLSQWIISQYKEEKERLRKDAQAILTRVESRLTDSILDQAVSGILQSYDLPNPHLAIKVRTGVGDRSIAISDSPVKVIVALNSSSPANPKVPVSEKHVLDQQLVPVPTPDTLVMPEEEKKMLRFALKQITGKVEINTYNRDIRPDSSILKMELTHALRQQLPGLTLNWTRADTANKGIMLTSHGDARKGLALKGYNSYLLKTIWPQIVFSGLLLLLTSLAFLMAYQNMKQQSRFVAQKDSFISNIAHELKTPVATSQVALEALSNYSALEDPMRSRKYLQLARWEMGRLNTMIDRVMNTLQTEKGALSLERRVINLKDILVEILDNLQPQLIEKGITLYQKLAEPEIPVYADRIHLLNAIYNIMDNAIKYGGNQIKIELKCTAGEAILLIADNGPGIPKPYQKKIFEKFFRVPEGNKHSIKGHGLGLSYALYIVQAHHGNLTLDTSNQNTCFSFTLPQNLPV